MVTFPRTRVGDPVLDPKKHKKQNFSPQMLCLFRSFILFPAYAGVILVPELVLMLFITFPRTCGGDPTS